MLLVRPPASATGAAPGSPSTLSGPAEHPWRVFGPPDLVVVRRPSAGTLRILSPGTPVCLVLDAPGSRGRLRRIARRAGLDIERELIALPSTVAPIVILDDAADPVARLWRDIATVPPGVVRGCLAGTLAIRTARLMPWRWTGAIAPGRALIGRMP